PARSRAARETIPDSLDRATREGRGLIAQPWLCIIAATGGHMESDSNAARAARYIQTVASASSADEVAAFFAPDVVMHELPDRIAPHGRRRTLADLRAAFATGRTLLRSQTSDVREMIGMGNEVDAEVEWAGTLAE